MVQVKLIFAFMLHVDLRRKKEKQSRSRQGSMPRSLRPFSRSGKKKDQERKRQINLRKILGHRPGVPGDPAGQTGVYRPVSQGFPVVYHRKLIEKGKFAGTPAGCPRDTRGFSEILCDFFGSLHHFHVIYSKSRNYTWKAGMLCVCN